MSCFVSWYPGTYCRKNTVRATQSRQPKLTKHLTSRIDFQKLKARNRWGCPLEVDRKLKIGIILKRRRGALRYCSCRLQLPAHRY